MDKKQVRLTESDLRQIVKESVKRILKENDAQKEIEEIDRKIEELKDQIFDLEWRKHEIIDAHSEPGDTPSDGWTRGPEPYFTRGY